VSHAELDTLTSMTRTSPEGRGRAHPLTADLCSLLLVSDLESTLESDVSRSSAAANSFLVSRDGLPETLIQLVSSEFNKH
jgi:hypothetical protein